MLEKKDVATRPTEHDSSHDAPIAPSMAELRRRSDEAFKPATSLVSLLFQSASGVEGSELEPMPFYGTDVPEARGFTIRTKRITRAEFEEHRAGQNITEIPADILGGNETTADETAPASTARVRHAVPRDGSSSPVMATVFVGIPSGAVDDNTADQPPDPEAIPAGEEEEAKGALVEDFGHEADGAGSVATEESQSDAAGRDQYSSVNEDVSESPAAGSEPVSTESPREYASATTRPAQPSRYAIEDKKMQELVRFNVLLFLIVGMDYDRENYAMATIFLGFSLYTLIKSFNLMRLFLSESSKQSDPQ